MFIGYARVSTPSQSLDLQIDSLVQAGCDKKKIFTDIASGSKTARPGLDKALDYAREGDILVVWKLDRLAGLKQISSPNKAQSSLISNEYVMIVAQPLDEAKRHCCAKRL